ncbi:hypothetical protein [Brevundimonas sp.]|uniref:hypothetical protein n=1 Tax=Brevundimonas sp. TaxID=1871086 RepID=UPI003BA9AE64
MRDMTGARAAIPAALLGLALLAGCAMTPRIEADPILPSTPASSEDCSVFTAMMELFPRPLDGSPLRIYAYAVPEDPPYQPQRAEQRTPGRISLEVCPIPEIAFVRDASAITLGRPEIHDGYVIVPYRESSQHARVRAVLEPVPGGRWRHRSAYLSVD